MSKSEGQPYEGLMNTEGAAGYLRISKNHLEKLRVTGGGPEFVKLGRAVRYERAALDHWVTIGRRRSTSDKGAAA